MTQKITQAKINWFIPAKDVYSDGISNREIIVTKNFISNKCFNTKNFFKNPNDNNRQKSGVQFDDFKVRFDGRILDVLRDHKNVFLSRFKTAGVNINLYVNNNNEEELIPYVTVTTQSVRNEYFLLVSNNNQRHIDAFNISNRFVGYLGYNIYGCKLITVGKLSNRSIIPLYIKSGVVTFTQEDDLDNEPIKFNVKNLMLYNKVKNERVLYKRLFTCESNDYKIDVKFMKILLQDDIVFDLYGKFLDTNNTFNVDALKNLKNFSFDSSNNVDGITVSSKQLYQFNVLYTDKETGDRRGIGYTYFPILL